MTRIPELPVFQLIGGREDVRGDFAAKLMAELDHQTLSSTLLKCKDGASPLSVTSLVKQFDLVIVDGVVDLPMQRVEIGGGAEPEGGTLVWSGGDDRQMRQFMTEFIKRLNILADQMEVWACILIGGRSSRMGRPKHLIRQDNGTTWLERTTDILRPLVDGLVVSGAGLLPETLSSLTRLPDVPGVVGPLTGILAASRWQPMVTWLLVACDMPHISAEAVQWLLSGRKSGCWGRVPRLAVKDHYEPLFAWYDFRAAQLFENQLYHGNLRIGKAASHRKIENPVIPESLVHAWQNFNRPEQIE